MMQSKRNPVKAGKPQPVTGKAPAAVQNPRDVQAVKPQPVKPARANPVPSMMPKPVTVTQGVEMSKAGKQERTERKADKQAAKTERVKLRQDARVATADQRAETMKGITGLAGDALGAAAGIVGGMVPGQDDTMGPRGGASMMPEPVPTADDSKGETDSIFESAAKQWNALETPQKAGVGLVGLGLAALAAKVLRG